MISVKDLSFSYGSKGVLKNISVDFAGGNIYGLLGENGVGKTTFLTLLAGLKKAPDRFHRHRRTYPLRPPAFLPGRTVLPPR